MRLKYIVTENGSFALFTETATHSDIARGMYGKPAGAGFANIAVGYSEKPHHDLDIERRTVNVHCYGESVSLGLSSREEDERIINNALANQY